eukprot:6185105-Pleurochrysis_carterae.AAC.1
MIAALVRAAGRRPLRAELPRPPRSLRMCATLRRRSASKAPRAAAAASPAETGRGATSRARLPCNAQIRGERLLGQSKDLVGAKALGRFS